MKRFDYIEEVGMTYTDIVVEIFNMKLTYFSCAYNQDHFYRIIHNEDQLDKVCSHMYPVRSTKKHIFHYSDN